MAKEEASIIEIIQEMVAKGESEEKIVKTLKDLGVEPEKAKRLLLLGQADTFALLKNEIVSFVKQELATQQPEIKKFIQDETTRAGQEMKKTVENAVMTDIKNYEKDITGQSKTFQEQINDTVQKMADLNTRVKEQLNALGEKVGKVEQDLGEVKVKGIGGRNRLISNALIVVGFVSIAFSLYSFFINFQGVITIDSIILMVITALIGITMLFVATVI